MEEDRLKCSTMKVFDMACGSGEATIALVEWWKAGRSVYDAPHSPMLTASHSRKAAALTPPSLGPELQRPRIYAADPYTAEALQSRTGLYNCSTLSFKDVAEGSLPTVALSTVSTSTPNDTTTDAIETVDSTLEMTLCSFALHLVESQSELFSLLWELSTKCRWLIVVAPHKRPEIKEGWGWVKWDVESWAETQMSDSKGEILQDRVHCRVYRSVNIHGEDPLAEGSEGGS